MQQSKLSKLLILSIVLLFTFGQIATDLYLPSLVSIHKYFDTSTNMAQFTITIYIISMAITQPLYGIASDGYGRKPMLYIGVVLALIGSIICIFANSIYILIFGRFIQGLGAGAGATVGRAIIRDLYTSHDLIKASSKISIANIAFMITAPALGGYIEFYLQWQIAFIILFLISIINLLSLIYIITETSVHHNKNNLKINIIYKNIIFLLQNKNFVYNSLIALLLYGGIFAWITAGPILLIKIYNIDSITLGWIYCLIGFMYIIGNLINKNIIQKTGSKNMIYYGLCLISISVISLILIYNIDFKNYYYIIIAILFYMTGCSIIYPSIAAGALNNVKSISGMASSIFGVMQLIGAITTSFLIVISHTHNVLPIAIIYFIIAILGFYFNTKIEPVIRKSLI